MLLTRLYVILEERKIQIHIIYKIRKGVSLRCGVVDDKELNQIEDILRWRIKMIFRCEEHSRLKLSCLLVLFCWPVSQSSVRRPHRRQRKFSYIKTLNNRGYGHSHPHTLWLGNTNCSLNTIFNAVYFLNV